MLYRDILKLHLSSELFRNCLSYLQLSGTTPNLLEQPVLSSQCSAWRYPAAQLSTDLKPRQWAEICRSTGAASHCCPAQAGTDRKVGCLGCHSYRTNHLCFSLYGVSSRLVSDKEPIMLCKNSPHNSKAYSSPEFSVTENKRFEGFCSRLQESKQKGEDKRWWIDTAQRT